MPTEQTQVEILLSLRGSLVFVQWLDAADSGMRWVNNDDAHKLQLNRCMSIGWLIQASDECITIAGTGAEHGDSWSGDTSIPISTLVAIFELKDTPTGFEQINRFENQFAGEVWSNSEYMNHVAETVNERIAELAQQMNN